MNNNYEKMKKTVLGAVRARAAETRPTRMTISNGPKNLGQYLQNCLKQHEMSRVTFAQSLDMETELVDAILDGVLPASELHTELLTELAEAIGCEPERLLQVLKGDLPKTATGWASLA